MIELSQLPPEVLEVVFEFLDAQEIITVTEACSKFNGIVTNSERLTKKLTLYLRYPLDLNGIGESIIHSHRRYRNLRIIKSREGRQEFCDPQTTNRLFRKLGETVQDLKIDWSNAMRPREASLFELMVRRRGAVFARGRAGNVDNFDDAVAAQALANVREDIYNEFVFIVRFFNNVRKMFLFNVHLEKGRQPNEPELNYPHLKELIVKHCDSYCFELLSSCTQLEKMNVSDPFWNSRNPGVDTFEGFLIRQKVLKDLELKNFTYPRLFQVDRTANIHFRLNSLVLKQVYFADKEIADNFFRTQNELKIVDFQLHNEKVRCLDELLWYNKSIKTIVTNNTHLHTINIAKLRYKLENCDFISKVVNPFVKKLVFDVTSEDKSSDLFKVFIRMFPNLEMIHFKAEESEETDSGICFDEGTILERVESLVIANSSVRSLVNVHAGALTSFEYVPGKTGEFIDDLFGGFFHRHRSIKHLVIGSPSERSYFFVSYNLCQLIVNFLTHLECITIYNFGEVNKSVKLLCNLRKLQSLTISTEDYQQFTAKTKVECARNNLKLINVSIPLPTNNTAVQNI